MTLQELSFRPEEVFPGKVQSHRALVPATVNGESVYLALATEFPSPAMLTLDYIGLCTGWRRRDATGE